MTQNARKALVPLTVALVAGAVAVGSGATWTAKTQSDVSVTGGLLSHSNDRNNATLGISNIKPGDSLEGTVTVVNTGDIDSKLTLVSANAISGFAPTMLTLKVEADYDNDGTWVTLFNGDLSAVSLNVEDATFDQGQTNKYRFTVALDPTSTNVDQGKTASVEFDFDQTEGAADSLTDIWS
ncbi:hypothetical protein ACFP3Q_09570 [Nocardioides sp. GCM10027113]|uniref:hypothetical protein n=1 Tax=unclassified Nocardioides TaxID=2615069 RepID=UPI00361C95C3